MFKEHFKKYKDKNSSLSEVYDVNETEKIKSKTCKIPIDGNLKVFFGMIDPSLWEIYEFTENPGLIFIKNPFTTVGQRYWTIKSLKYYTRNNRTNLDIHNVLEQNEKWWEKCCQERKSLLLKKLRWVTLGYHHDWDSKVYDESLKDEFPCDLQCLSRYIASALGYNNFNAQAAIVNLYHMNSTLSGHTDHSEKDLEAPLLSFSFGQTAIFLLGGKTIDEKPNAFFLRSGDIVVMSKESRLSYHGIPRILHADSEPWNESLVIDCTFKCDECFDKLVIAECLPDNCWKPFNDYLCNSRINVNVRQVLCNGQSALDVIK